MRRGSTVAAREQTGHTSIMHPGGLPQHQDSMHKLARAPAAFFGIVPGGRLGVTERHGVAELKAAVSGLVVLIAPGAVFMSGESVEPLLGFDHLTVHRDLMVHLRGKSGTRTLVKSSVHNGVLTDSAVHLASFSVPPTATAISNSGRFQTKYQGGIPVLPFAPDPRFVEAATHLIVDLWASQPWFEAPGFLPPSDPSFRPAISHSGATALGPMTPAWAFREGVPPPCVFHLRFWYVEYPALNVQVIRAAGSCLHIESNTCQ